jgi:hypothetical protein
VGDGSQINIWEDNWIPSSHNLKIMTPRGSNILTRVANLINPIDGLWDEDLIGEIIWSIDAHRILQIPLTPNREDFVAWHHNKLGLFSIRSAYFVSGIISSDNIIGMLIYRRVLIIQFGGNCGT